MKYMGSKSRIAKYIVPIIQSYITDETTLYLEPFVGGANIIDKIQFNNKYGSDKNKYLIALLKRVQENYETDDNCGLLLNVSKEAYDDARTQFNTGNQTDEDWYIGNIGFIASFNGRWFDGGYAKAGYEKTKNGLKYRDYYQEARRNLINQAKDLQGIKFEVCDYRELMELNIKHAVIYCDPPYQNTTQYINAIKFDYDLFWNNMRKWSEDNTVLISEENAPEDFECIWSQEVSRSIKATDKSKSVEKLFKMKG